jgi:hypothetical protein
MSSAHEQARLLNEQAARDPATVLETAGAPGRHI